MSIRFRLTAWYLTAMTLTLLVAATAVYMLTRAGLTDWLDDLLVERVQTLAESVRLEGPARRPVLPTPGHDAYSGPEDGFFLLDGTGRLVTARSLDASPFLLTASVGRARSGLPAEETVSLSSGDAWRIAAHPLLAEGRVACVIGVAHSLKEQALVLDRLKRVMWTLLPLGVLVAGLGGWLLAGRMLRPVSGIVQAAEAISEHDLTLRIPVTSQDELGHLAATFNALIARLQDAFERQRRFTADAAHELRTPVTTIRAIAGPKVMQERSAAEYRSALQRIDDVAAYMGRLVADLLALARFEEAAKLERTAFDMRELAGLVAEQIEEISGHPVRVLGEAAVPLVGDETRLTQLLLNLVGNAVRHTGPEAEVAIEVVRADGAVRVVVCDGGEGIPAEHLPHLCEPFYRVDAARSRETGGTGLGLAIGRRIVEQHGGGMEIRSEVGSGTTVVVTLPTGAA